MLLLLWSPFKLQLNEGSFTSDKNWHPANTISQQICHKTLKYCQGQINVCDNSQNNLALHNRYNVMWHRKQPSLSKHRCLEAVCGSSILSRALASTRLTSKGQDRLHQEDAKRTLTIACGSQRTSQEKKSVLWKSTAPSLIISKSRPQYPQGTPLPLQMGWHWCTDERTWQAEDSSVRLPSTA